MSFLTISHGIPPPSLLARLPPRLKGLLRGLALTYLGQRERRRFDSRRVIWVLAHMRSGSTLLMHLLSSHPEILGAGERNAVCSTPNDFLRLSVSAAYARRQLFRDYRYVVDQINHNRFLTSPSLLDHPRLYRVFLIREPPGSLHPSRSGGPPRPRWGASRTVCRDGVGARAWRRRGTYEREVFGD